MSPMQTVALAVRLFAIWFAIYAGAMAIRKGASIGNLKIVEGYDGPQPADS